MLNIYGLFRSCCEVFFYVVTISVTMFIMFDLLSFLLFKFCLIISVNSQAQAQALVQVAQALVQSPFESDVFEDFSQGPFNSCVGCVCGLVLRSRSMRESRWTKLAGFRGCSTQAENLKTAIRLTRLTDSVDRINQRAGAIVLVS